MGVIITGTIMGIVAIAGIVYSIFLFNEKGPILTNTFLLFSEQERIKMNIDIHKEYRDTAIVYLFLSIALGVVSIAIVSLISWLFTVAVILLILVAVFVFVSWLISETKSGK